MRNVRYGISGNGFWRKRQHDFQAIFAMQITAKILANIWGASKPVHPLDPHPHRSGTTMIKIASRISLPFGCAISTTHASLREANLPESIYS